MTWAHTRLRDQIQQAGAGLAPAAQTANMHTRDTDRTPLADKEPEP